jgi:hypothetical protein
MTSESEQAERALADADRPEDPAGEEPLAPDIPPDRTRRFTHTSFSRMRTEWRGDDAERLAVVSATAREIIRSEFRMALAVTERIHRYVRTPLINHETGEVQAYPDGTPMWETDELGCPVEDWALLTDDARKGLMLTIATWLGEWELKSAELWAEAMYAKVQWEEAFSRGFIALPGAVISGKPTIDDRTQWGHHSSADERYFAVFRSALSRAAEGEVRSMGRLLRVLEATSAR